MLKSSFREERFSDRVSGSTADGTTCYPGRRQWNATAHYGVSVTIKGSENERAQPINRQETAKNLNGPRAVFRKVFFEQREHQDWSVAFQAWVIIQPSCSGVRRPVFQRHRSTSSCRAKAMMARLRARR